MRKLKKGDIIQFTCFYPVGYAASLPLFRNPPDDWKIQYRGIVQNFLAADVPIVSTLSQDSRVWFVSVQFEEEEWVAMDDWDECKDCLPGKPCEYHISTPVECRAI